MRGYSRAESEDEMKADQLIHQYHAKTITARELVEGVWDTFETLRHVTFLPYPRWIKKEDEDEWTAAAAFTISRIEEIRLSEEDTLLIFKKMAACYLRRKESYQRILFRERAHLDSLTKGMKPEVLE